MVPPNQLDRLELLSFDRFAAEYLVPMRPVLVSGGTASWPAIKLWTDAYLKGKAGRVRLRVKPKADFMAGLSMRESERSDEFALSDILDSISSQTPPELCYARESHLLAEVPALQDDIRIPEFVIRTRPHTRPRTGYDGPIMWLGPANTVAQLHWDPEHNVFTQVRGRKEVILVPPEDAGLTYPVVFSIDELARKEFFRGKGADLLKSLVRVSRDSSADEWPARVDQYQRILRHAITKDELSLLCDYLLEANNCGVDAHAPDLSKHPQFVNARRYHAALMPGDLLFIPCFWHHWVRSLEPSISVNWFFLQRSAATLFSDDWVADILLRHLVP